MSFGLNREIFSKQFTNVGTYQTEGDVRSIINQYFPNTFTNYSSVVTEPSNFKNYILPIATPTSGSGNKKITVDNFLNNITQGTSGISVSSDGKIVLEKVILKRYGNGLSTGVENSVKNELVYFDNVSGVSYLGLCTGTGPSWLGVSLTALPF